MGKQLALVLAMASACASTRPASVALKDVYFHGDKRAEKTSNDPLMVALASNDTGPRAIVVSRTLVDEKGNLYTFNASDSATPVSADVPPGNYKLRILADCQEPVEQKVVVRGDVQLDYQYPPTLGATAYLTAETTPMAFGIAAPRTLAYNAKVQKVRLWPTAEDFDAREQRMRSKGEELRSRRLTSMHEVTKAMAQMQEDLVLRPDQCHAAIVQVPDESGLYLVPVASLAATPASNEDVAKTKQAEEEARRREEEAQQARRAAIEAELDGEIKAGKCTAEHDRVLQQVMSGMNAIFGDGTQGLVVLDFKIGIVSPTAKPMPFAYRLTGEYHLFAMGFSASTVSGGAGPSPYETGIRNLSGGLVSSAVAQASQSNQPALSISGRGCALLVFAKKL